MEKINEMREALEEYYEAAGFSDFERRTLKGKSDDEILKAYDMTFNQSDVAVDK
jgi:hypothetical protein